MASITIRNLDETLKSKLRVEAANHGHSMEEEVRIILRRALLESGNQTGLGGKIRTRFTELEGVELELPDRTELARAANFSE